jgi:pyruvate dehydrogenase E2 component (dihydrolipoamide acetyltransferase)
MFDFQLPDIGEGISEALLIEWFVAPGDQVKEGDDVATVSTDKVDVELPAPRTGVITELCWTPGDTVPVGEVLLRIDGGDGKAPAARAKTSPKAGEGAAKSIKTSKTAKPVQPVAAPDAPVVAAPVTRKLAAELGVEIETLRGSGKDGRIVRADVEAAAIPPLKTAIAQTPGDEVVREALNSVRAVAFERLGQSVRTLAHTTMNFEAEADAFLAVLQKRGPAAEKVGVTLTPTALFAKCIAVALQKHPRFNATIDEQTRELLLHRRVNLSVAVASDAGLLVPVVQDVGAMTLFETATAIHDVARRAREGRMELNDTRGGTFTLSNTGGLERARMLSTRPVINPPQTAILWVSRINEHPRAKDGVLEVGPMMNCSLSFDHRFLDGADGTRFINDLAGMLEYPEAAMHGD